MPFLWLRVKNIVFKIALQTIYRDLNFQMNKIIQINNQSIESNYASLLPTFLQSYSFYHTHCS